MDQLIQLLTQYSPYIMIGMSLLIIIILILLMVNMSKVKKIQRKYEKFMIKEDVDLENLLVHYAKKVNKAKDVQSQLQEEIEKLQQEMKMCVQKVGILRYKAIENVGADLSFAIALLDANNDGVVVNGIYSRDGSYTYAKPLKNSESTYTLSDEEKEAIEIAKDNNQLIK